MPYFITDTAEGCSGWATIKDDGEVIGCHTTKQDAIDQMVAVSIAEDMEPGGERALPNTLEIGDYVSWNSSGGRARGEIVQIATSGSLRVPETDFEIEATEDNPAALIQIYQEVEGGYESTDTVVGHKFSTLTKIDPLEEVDSSMDDDMERTKWRSIAINLNKDEGQQMTTTVERRVSTVEFDVRNGEASSDGMSFTGYAAVFNSPSEPLPFTEVIKEGAFKRSLKSRNEIKLFMNHNTDVVLGSTRAGTLKLTEDSRGLLAQANLPDTSAGRDLSVLMKRGDVSSMSFGFSVPPKGDSWSQDGATRELHQVRLHEVSIVTGFPAYEATTASVRSLDILAQRTAVDVDALSDAITKLEAGETLEAGHADLITEVVSKLRAQEPTNFDLLEIKRKQLDLMLKAF